MRSYWKLPWFFKASEALSIGGLAVAGGQDKNPVLSYPSEQPALRRGKLCLFPPRGAIHPTPEFPACCRAHSLKYALLHVQAWGQA